MRLWPFLILALAAVGCSGGGSDETPKVSGTVEVKTAPPGQSREDKMANSRARALQGREGEEGGAVGDGR